MGGGGIMIANVEYSCNKIFSGPITVSHAPIQISLVHFTVKLNTIDAINMYRDIYQLTFVSELWKPSSILA